MFNSYYRVFVNLYTSCLTKIYCCWRLFHAEINSIIQRLQIFDYRILINYSPDLVDCVLFKFRTERVQWLWGASSGRYLSTIIKDILSISYVIIFLVLTCVHLKLNRVQPPQAGHVLQYELFLLLQYRLFSLLNHLLLDLHFLQYYHH